MVAVKETKVTAALAVVIAITKAMIGISVTSAVWPNLDLSLCIVSEYGYNLLAESIY